MASMNVLAFGIPFVHSITTSLRRSTTSWQACVTIHCYHPLPTQHWNPMSASLSSSKVQLKYCTGTNAYELCLNVFINSNNTALIYQTNIRVMPYANAIVIYPVNYAYLNSCGSWKTSIAEWNDVAWLSDIIGKSRSKITPFVLVLLDSLTKKIPSSVVEKEIPFFAQIIMKILKPGF